MFVTKSADRSDKRDERGELETAIYVVIYCHLALCYTLKKIVKIKLEDRVNREENCLLTVWILQLGILRDTGLA